MYHGKTVGVVIPAHNEESSIAKVVQGLIELGTVVDHIIVCDNASSDSTAQFARRAGASVVHESYKGYGAACLSALEHLSHADGADEADGTEGVDWIVFTDGDNAMQASDLPRLLDELENGANLVIGSRTLGQAEGLVEAGALTPHQRWGNWLAAYLLTAIWRKGIKGGTQAPVTDLGPYRAISRIDLDSLDMQDKAFGWTVEMQAKALDANLSISEIPVASRRRIGKSKVSGTWRGSLGAALGILGTIARIGGPALWAQLVQSINIVSVTKDSMWKKPY